MLNNKGLILTVTLIFVITFTIISATAIILMTNHARLTESQIRRIKAFYTAEAGIAHALEELRKSPSSGGPWSIAENGLTADVTLEASKSGPNNTKKLTCKVQY